MNLKKKLSLIFIIFFTFFMLQLNIARAADRELMPPDPEVYSEEFIKEYSKDEAISNTEFEPIGSALFSDYLISSQISQKYNSGNTEKVLIIPVTFSDVDFQNKYDMAHFQRIGESLKSYFEINSNYSQGISGITLDCQVSEPVYSEHTMAYYGADNPITGGIDDANGSITALTEEAVNKLVETGFDLSPFDLNNDKIVDHVIIIHAGKGQEQSVDKDLIWSHQFHANKINQPSEYYVYDYTMAPENGELGVFAHEFAHDLGLPDLYDTNGSVDGYSYGIGRWGLMGNGAWNHLPNEPSGSTPANLSAWSRVYMNWVTPTVLTYDALGVPIINQNGNSEVYKIQPQVNTGINEYFLVEYRRKIGYDAALPGEGALVWHVDKDVVDTTLSSNSVNNNDARLGLELEQADGKWDLWTLMNQGDETDPFSGSSYSNHFTASPYGLNLSNKTSISTYVECINFETNLDKCFFDVYVSPSTTLKAAIAVAPIYGARTSSKPLFMWEPVAQATAYRIEIATDINMSKNLKTIMLTQLNKNFQYNGSQYSYLLEDNNKLVDGQTYYWRVAGTNSLTQWITFSQTSEIKIVDQSYNSMLNFSATDIIQSEDSPFIYLTDRDGYRLYRLNYETNETRYIDFTYKPERMYMKDDKLFVTLIHREHDNFSQESDETGSFAVIGLTDFELERIYNVEIDPFDIVVSKDNVVVISSGSSQWTSIKSYALDTGLELSKKMIRQRSYLDYNSVLNQIYVVDTDSIPRDHAMYKLEPNGALTFIHNSIYHVEYELRTNFKLSPDGKYVFNGSGDIFTCTNTSTTDLIHHASIKPFKDIYFDLSDDRIYTIENDVMTEYQYSTLSQLSTVSLTTYVENDRLLRYKGILIGVDLNVDKATTILREFNNEEIVPNITFSFDGIDAGRLIGSKPGMTFTIGNITGKRQPIRTENMLLTSTELTLLKSTKKLYVFLDDAVSTNSSNTRVVEVVERNAAADINFFDKLIWSEETNKIFGIDQRFEYFHEGMDKWEKYPLEGIKSLDSGLVYIRYAASGNFVEGAAYSIELAEKNSFGNEFAWKKGLTKEVVWENDDSAYVLFTDSRIVHLNLATNTIEYISAGNDIQSIYFVTDTLYGVKKTVTDGVISNELVRFSRQNNIEEQTIEVLNALPLNSSLLGISNSKLIMINTVTKVLLAYDFTSKAYETVKFDDGTVSISGSVSVVNNFIVTSAGSVYEYNGVSNNYVKVKTLTPFVQLLDYDKSQNMYLVVDNDYTLYLYNKDFNVTAVYDAFGTLMNIRMTDAGFICLLEDDHQIRLGKVLTWAQPNVSFDLAGANKNILVGSTSEMEISYDGSAYFRIPYNNYRVDMSLVSAQNDISIRYRATVNALENRTLILDIKEANGLPQVTGDDLLNTILGITPEMEYSIDNKMTWIDGATGLPNLTGDVVMFVRLKAKGLTLASESIKLTYLASVIAPPSTPPTPPTPPVPPVIPTVPVVPTVIPDENLPEEELPKASTFVDSIHLGFEETLLSNYVDVTAFDKVSHMIETNVASLNQSNLKSQYLDLVGKHTYSFELIGQKGSSKTSIVTLKSLAPMIIDIDLSQYSINERQLINVYYLNNDNWEYVESTYDSVLKRFTFSTSKTGLFAVMKGNRTFADISSHWARHYIEIMAAKQITNGKSNNQFDPNSNITRAEYVALITRSIGLKKKTSNSKIYADVNEKDWYFDLISIANEQGLIQSNVSFDPEVDILREDMMAIVVEALKKRIKLESLSKDEVDRILSPYKDSQYIMAVNREAVALAIKYGVITGRKTDYLAIRETASRAETMVVISRLLEKNE